jgi:hypothetical protein
MRQKFPVWSGHGRSEFGPSGLSLAARYGGGLIVVAVAAIGIGNVYSQIVIGPEPGSVADGVAGSIFGIGRVNPAPPTPRPQPQSIGFAAIGASDPARADRLAAAPLPALAQPSVESHSAESHSAQPAQPGQQADTQPAAETPTPVDPPQPKRGEKSRSGKKYARSATEVVQLPDGRQVVMRRTSRAEARYTDGRNFDSWNGNSWAGNSWGGNSWDGGSWGQRSIRRVHMARPGFDSQF